ncbi:MAG: hypothetical protein WAP58_05580 [Peptococcia bacterium]
MIIRHNMVKELKEELGVTNDTTLTRFITPKKARKIRQTSFFSKGPIPASAIIDKQKIYKLISEKYDIRKASYAELCDMTKALYDYGIITSGERALILFNPKLYPPEFIRLNYPNYRYFLLETDDNGRRDWLQEFEARIEKNYAEGNSNSAKYRERLLEILKRLERKNHL